MASTTAPNPVPDQRKIGMDSLLLRILQIYNTIMGQFLMEKRIGLQNFKCQLYSVVSNFESLDARSFPLGKVCVRARSKFESESDTYSEILAEHKYFYEVNHNVRPVRCSNI